MTSENVNSHENNPVRGIAWFLLHCLMFALISVVTKILMNGGMHVFEIVFFQTLFGTIILLPRIIKRHSQGIRALSYKLQISRALFWSLATICFFYATTVIPVGRAIAISFAVPLFTTILAVVFLKEKLHFQRITALVCGFIGMLIIIRPGVESFEFASFLVVVASFMWSMTDIMIKLVGKTHHVFVNTFYFSFFGAICTLPMALAVWHTPSVTEMFWLILLSIMFVANIASITKAYELGDLTVMMPFVFAELIFVAVLAYFIFDEVIYPSTVIGSAIIIFSTSYIAYRERKSRSQLLTQEKLVKELARNLDENIKI